jgi:hypothetical protein
VDNCPSTNIPFYMFRGLLGFETQQLLFPAAGIVTILFKAKLEKLMAREKINSVIFSELFFKSRKGEEKEIKI